MAPTLSPLSPALPLLLALLCATTGLGAQGGPCELPPQEWCRSWDSALHCGALGLCARLAWAPPGSDICKDFVTLLVHMANESATKVAVESFLRRECAALPVPSMVTPCQNLVHEYLELLVTDLQEHLKPSWVCGRLDLCPGGAPALPPLGALSTRLKVAVPLPQCWLCRTMVSRLEATVPVERVAAVASGLCHLLPLPLTGACQCLAQRYTALLLERLLGQLGPRVLCRFLRACGEGDTRDPLLLPPPEPPLRDDEEAASPDGDFAKKPPVTSGWQLGDTREPPAACAGTQEMGQGPPALSPKLGPCALGPIYWCSSPGAALRCQALQHCQEHIWA
ncbi:pulmonary surfactant-associated protein B [Heliangelus exortis]|uniref:pulmonary surfactant-associated protein B n=1 Tax=Heliangelus exortis TaxID=472823 RepID=UPI003A9173CF